MFYPAEQNVKLKAFLKDYFFLTELIFMIFVHYSQCLTYIIGTQKNDFVIDQRS